jgi:uncharacterized protein YllA (UPF0747 family)
MRLALHSRLPVEDAAQRVLFASPDQGAGTLGNAPLSETIYPGGHFRSEAHVARRLAHLDARASRGERKSSGPWTANGTRDASAGPPDPAALQDFLRHENAFAPLTPEQRANLDAVGSKHAVYMLTGQQPGLLGGPILWYYKALTCAALARDWAARLGRPVIPIFWVAGDDADLDECNHVELLDPRAADVRGNLGLDFPNAARPLAMGERRVEEAQLQDLLKRLGAAWAPEVLDQLGRAYPTPSTLSGGFLRLAQAQLGREGILFVDGYSKNLRALARPVLDAAIAERDAWHDALKQGTASAAAAGIPAQVELRDGVVHAFALRGGERHRLFAENRNGKSALYTPEHPNRDLSSDLASVELTHDVFSRPLAADAIFPVLGHVLGPAELRYFAQLAPLFLKATGDMPLIQPRMTAAVTSQKAFDAFANEGLNLPEVLRFGPAALRARLAERAWRAHPGSSAVAQAPAEKWLESARKIHDRHFKDTGPFDRFEKEIASSWKRYLRSLERAAYAGAAGSTRHLFDHLRWLGNGQGQDRHLNLGSVLNAIGKDGLAKLRAEMDPLSAELQLFTYGGD